MGVLALLLAGAALAQVSSEGGIAIPIDLREVDLKKYDVVELAGASAPTDLLDEDGNLPRSIVDYSSRMGEVSDRMTLFDNGIISLELRSPAGRISKKLRVPEDAVAVYAEFFKGDGLASFRPLDAGQAHDRVVLRLRTSDGTPVEKSFPATAVLPEEVERYRRVLQDMIRVLAEDREITNPISTYDPKVGEFLLTDDRKMWKITRLIDGGDVLELVATDDPLRRYVQKKDLYLYFIGSKPAAP